MIHKTNSYTKQDFIDYMNTHYGDKFTFDISEYENMKTIMKFHCNDCNQNIEITPDNIKKVGCKFCNKREKQQKFFEDFVLKSKEKFGEIKFNYNNVKYIDGKTKIRLHCNKCHNDFTIVPRSHLNSETGCVYCSGIRVSKMDFMKRSKQIHGENCYDYSLIDKENIKMGEKVTLRCFKCGEIFTVNAENHIAHHSGCPQCTKKKFLLEETVTTLLDKEYNMKYKRQYAPNWLKTNRKRGIFRLDFYLPNYNIAIECQGEQHFHPVDFAGKGKEWAIEQYKNNVERDKRKKRLCEENGVALYYISYDENVEEKLHHIITEIKTEG